MTLLDRVDLYRCKVSERTDWMVIRLTSRSGAVGFGEFSDAGPWHEVLGRAEEMATPLLDRRMPCFDALPCAESGDFVTRTIRGGVEQALCDLEAREEGVPLWKWLGGNDPGPLQLYANLNRVPGGRSPSQVAASAEDAVAAGFGTVKIAPFDVPGRQDLPCVGLRRAQAVRKAVGSAIGLLVDCHERLPLDQVEKLLPAFEDLDVGWLEDAVGIDDVAALRYLRARTPLRLAGGEFASRPEQIQASNGYLHVVMPDVKHAGGLLPARRLAACVTEAEVSLHNPSGPIATLATAHLHGVLPQANVLEYAFGEVPWRSDLVLGSECVTKGHLILPPGPGLGCDFDTLHPAVVHLSSLTRRA